MAKKQFEWRRVGLIFLGIVLVLTGIVGLLIPIVPGVLFLLAGTYLLSPRFFSHIRAALKLDLLIFRQSLPLRKQASSSGTADCSPFLVQSVQAPSPAGNSKQAPDDIEEFEPKILIFDPDPQDLARNSETFEARGFEVHKCLSAEAAMRCIEREELDFAMVDQVSPAFEGLRIIRHLIRYNLRTPFVVLTSYKDIRCQEEALALGAADYLEKPISRTKITEIIDIYL